LFVFPPAAVAVASHQQTDPSLCSVPVLTKVPVPVLLKLHLFRFHHEVNQSSIRVLPMRHYSAIICNAQRPIKEDEIAHGEQGWQTKQGWQTE
jgi:hypothetical protein